MLEFLRGKASERKLRLFLVACARLVWDRLPPGEMREAVEVAERFADGLAADDERQRLSNRMWSIPVEYGRATGGNWFMARPREDVSAYMAATTSVGRLDGSQVTSRPTWQEGRRLTGARQPDLLRDIFGNPFRQVAFDPSWRTGAVTALAERMYAEREFGAMPGLADALQDAGCEDAAVLEHCQGPGPHVRGCHVVDLLLGRS
jgi:hypothetical protein